MIWRAIQRGVDARGVSEPLTLCLTLIFSSLVALITLEGCDGTVEIPCISDERCPEELICLQGACVGAQLPPGDAATLYREEMHLRLASDCGVCHGLSSRPRTSAPSAAPGGAFELPQLGLEPRDGGWRIYLDELNEGRLMASLRETEEELDSAEPAASRLLRYGRGEINLLSPEQPGGPLAHPRLYRAIPEDLPYQRLLAWVERWAKENPAPPPPEGLALPPLKEEVYPAFQADCLVCHRAPDGIAGFSLPEMIAPDDDDAWEALLALLTKYVDPDEPLESSLYLLVIGEQGHPLIYDSAADPLEPGLAALKRWLEGAQE